MGSRCTTYVGATFECVIELEMVLCPNSVAFLRDRRRVRNRSRRTKPRTRVQNWYCGDSFGTVDCAIASPTGTCRAGRTLCFRRLLRLRPIAPRMGRSAPKSPTLDGRRGFLQRGTPPEVAPPAPEALPKDRPVQGPLRPPRASVWTASDRLRRRR